MKAFTTPTPSPPSGGWGTLGGGIATLANAIGSGSIAKALLAVANAVEQVALATLFLARTEQVLARTQGVIASVLSAVVLVLRGILDSLSKGLDALKHINLSRIWQAIRRAYLRLRRLIEWYQRRIQEPLDRIRRQITYIYNRFFRPIIRLLDSFRVFVRVLALFDRKLAARLDHALFGLEKKLMAPLLAVLRRVNELSSYTRALITALGYLDRVLLLETLRRDASLVWQVLTNPLQRIFEPGAPAPAGSVLQVGQDARDYLLHGVGPYAQLELEWKRTFESVFEDMR